jgi:hypothetical protein
MPHQSITLPLPTLTAHIDRARKQLYGQAPAGARLFIQLNVRDRSNGSYYITATASGAYTLTPSSWEFTTGRLTMVNPAGHHIALEFGTTLWRVTLGNRCVGGYASPTNAPIVISLYGQDGALKGTQSTVSDYGTGGFNACFTTLVQSGDRFELIGGGNTMTFTVPAVTAWHDYARQVIIGQAIPHSTVHISFDKSRTCSLRANAAGQFGLDTSGLNLRIGEAGYITTIDTAGNSVLTSIRITGYQAFLPLVLDAGESP